MKELEFGNVKISDRFWNPRLEMNGKTAIFYQWEQLENTKNIDNFRILAGDKTGFRRGFFYCDSDAFKWLDAASRIYANTKDEKLKQKIDELTDLIQRCQDDDGYIYTYNQMHFPDMMWKNLQIEHELYCLGHLIEAGVYHNYATGEKKLLECAKKSANLIYRDFIRRGPKFTPGHQEIEIALLLLGKSLDDEESGEKYTALAEQLLMKRGKIDNFFKHMAGNALSQLRRARGVKKQLKAFEKKHPDAVEFSLPEHVKSKMPLGLGFRSLHLFGSGKYNQQHKPVIEQTVPEGHSVRYAYMMTGATKLLRTCPNGDLLKTIENAWDHMVQKRMFPTGGIGSIPIIEGFGYDYELNPFYAYCETCAALGCLFWNWELTLVTNKPKFSDLFEWQLYNASLSGIALNGTSYLYRNPLASKEDIKRESWYGTPCCPSNVSRFWASLGKYLIGYDESNIWCHQYIGHAVSVPIAGKTVGINMESSFPWKGKAKMTFEVPDPVEFNLWIRIPSWCSGYSIKVNGHIYEEDNDFTPKSVIHTACGYNPYDATEKMIKRTWNDGDTIEIEYKMDIRILSFHSRVKSGKDRALLTRGPVVYCLESVDNPEIDIFTDIIDSDSLKARKVSQLLNGIVKIEGKTQTGKIVNAIPYYAWANRGLSSMNTYLRIK